MTNKERLGEIEAKHSTLTVSSEKNGTEYVEVDVEDLVFLIQSGFKQAERVEELKKQNKRYQDMLVKIFKIVQNHQIMKISDEDYADAAIFLYKWIYDTGAIDHQKHFSELHGHDEFDSYQINLLLKRHLEETKWF